MEALLKVPEIAERLKLSSKTVYIYVESGEIPANLLIRVRGGIRMAQADLLKWVESRRGA